MGLFFAVKEVFFPAVSVENKWVVHIKISLYAGAKIRIIIDFTKCKAQNVKREVGTIECANVLVDAIVLFCCLRFRKIVP